MPPLQLDGSQLNTIDLTPYGYAEPTLATDLATEANRLWRPRGTALKALVDRSPLYGYSGPAGTGKSRTLIEKGHLLCEKYAGSRGLIVRKTRESLTEAALFTYENFVLPEGHAALDGARRSHRTSYHYPNGSQISVAGLDKPQKIMSTEYDWIYVQEGLEVSRSDIEMLMTRLRNGKMPYQQLFFDNNPGPPRHWIKAGSDKGDFPLYASYHQDNPVLWEECPDSELCGPGTKYDDHARDGRWGRWTARGLAYIKVLMGLTGPRRKRLFDGLWAGAEGAVYEEWDAMPDGPNELVQHFEPPVSWRRIWVVDFGFVNPFVLQCWAIDPQNRSWLYREFYHTRITVSDAIKEVLTDRGWAYDRESGEHTKVGEYQDVLPEVIICDWDAEGRATLEQESGLPTEAAYKSVVDGIQNVSKAIRRPSRSVLPMIVIMEDTLIRVDHTLRDAAKPTRTAEEFDSYVWNEKESKATGAQKDEPLKENDHGMDPCRYMRAFVDGLRDVDKASDVSMVLAGLDPSEIIKMIVAVIPHGKYRDRDDRRRDRDQYGGRYTETQRDEYGYALEPGFWDR